MFVDEYYIQIKAFPFFLQLEIVSTVASSRSMAGLSHYASALPLAKLIVAGQFERKRATLIGYSF